ncbi:MAG: glycosyltransferase [Deltaproteobacteria bacterium]|nr:glycosyltransferase [Deltaproteobacteria bacterium]
MSPLFFGAGAPEALEEGGMQTWVQAGLFWMALCERVRACAPSWNRIVAHWLVPSALAARAVAPQLPLTAYAHSGDVALLERIPCGPSIARILSREIDDLIFVSADLQDRFARLAGRMTGPSQLTPGRVARLCHLGPGPSPSPSLPSFKDARRDFRIAAGLRRTTVLSVGRLVPIKGFDILLRAVATAAACGVADDTIFPSAHPSPQPSTQPSTVGKPSMTVVILGEGPERRRLETMAQRLGVDLRLPGCVPRTEVPRWMAAADIYVQPSRPLANGRTEGLPLATLEAINAGLQVIASKTGGLGGLDGVTNVAPGDVKALSALLTDFAAKHPR